MKVKITEEVESEMLQIEREDGKVLFYGNHRDFDRSAESFSLLLTSLGIEVSIVKGEL